jgi:hypothetical protein
MHYMETLLFQILNVVAFALPVLLLSALWAYIATLRRQRFIRAYRFPDAVFAKVAARHPHLKPDDLQLVASGMQSFFYCRLRSPFAPVGMPSRVVDDFWHEFILDTKAYAAFCAKAFGRFFHHLPSSGAGDGKKKLKALRLTWRFACEEERLNLARPQRLPLLFAIDAQLAIAGGFTYSRDHPLHQANGAGCAGGGGCSGCGGGCGGG